jgi:HPt (histidine-containing phosphotransfer) domain-containing protein
MTHPDAQTGAKAPAGPGPPADEVLNRAAVLARVDHNVQLLKEVIGLFVQSCPRLVAEVCRAADARDAAQLQRAAHTLKGSVSFFAADRAAQAAQRLEAVAAAEDWAQAAPARAALQAEVERLRAVLAAWCEEGE